MTGETTFAETMGIAGGMGRFAGATGTIDEAECFDPETGHVEVARLGTITYDASHRTSMH